MMSDVVLRLCSCRCCRVSTNMIRTTDSQLLSSFYRPLLLVGSGTVPFTFLDLAGIPLPQQNENRGGRVRAGSDHGDDYRRSLSPITIGDGGENEDGKEEEQNQDSESLFAEDEENIGDDNDEETISVVSILTTAHTASAFNIFSRHHSFVSS